MQLETITLEAFICELNKVVSNTFDTEELLKSIARMAMDILGVERCSIMLLKYEKLHLEVASWNNFEPIEEVSVPVGFGIAGKVAKTKEPILIDDIEKSKFQKKNDTKYKTTSFLSIPLLCQNECLGVLNVNNKVSGDKFNELDLHFLNILGSTAANSLKNAILIEKNRHFQERLTNIFFHLPIGVLTLNPQGDIELINPEAQTILEVQNIGGSFYENILPQQLIDIIKRWFFQYYDHKLLSSLVEEVEIKVGYNKIKPVQVVLNPIMNEEQLEGLILSLRDLTLSYEFERLKKIEEMRINFVSMISHELRTPLTSIKGALPIINAQICGENKMCTTMMGLVERNVNRLTRLINDLLNISLIQKDELRLDVGLHEISLVAEEAAGEIRPLAERKKIDIQSTYSEDLPTLPLDKAKIKKVFINLLENSVKFSDANTIIRINAEYNETENAVIFSIADQGRGIQPDNYDKVFRMFWQEDNSKTRDAGGTGIGLYISKNIITAHQGKIWFEPNSPQGIIFFMKFYKDRT